MTLSTDEIAGDILAAFTAALPPMRLCVTDVSPSRAAKDQTIITHVSSLPTVRDGLTSFEAGQAEAENILVDVPVTLDKLKHVTIRIDAFTGLRGWPTLYARMVENGAHALARQVFDDMLAEVTADNFSHETRVDELPPQTPQLIRDIRGRLNTQDAAPIGRFGIIHPDIAAEMAASPQIPTLTLYDQLTGAHAVRRFTNASGFAEIWEYADFPGDDGLRGFFGDPRAWIFASRLPDHGDALEVLDFPPVQRFETVTDAETGLTVLAIFWEQQGTLHEFMALAILYGIAAGKQGGAADSITDRAGHRLESNLFCAQGPLWSLDSIDHYDDGVSIDGENKGCGWAGAWVDAPLSTGLQSEDSLDSYADDADLDALDDGEGWAGPYADDDLTAP